MGDASAAIKIIRRMGLGKVTHRKNELVAVQEKEASRELQYHKVKRSDNRADLFTKALDHDSTVRDTEAMGCEFVFGRDPIAPHRHQPECKAEHGECGAGGGAPVQGKWTNGRVDANTAL